jgi:acetylglutamate kinase
VRDAPPPQVRASTVAKARTLIEALPFMQEHRGSVVVVKVGGAVMDRAPLSRSFAQDVSLLQHAGIHPVIVHGGGPQLTEVSSRLGLETTFVDGVRVTDRETLDVATMVLAGKVNTEIVAQLVAGDVLAVGLSGADGGLALVRRQTEPDLGYVGEIVRVRPEVVGTLLAQGFVPVVASIAADAEGHPFNVNADVMASELAIGLGARKLVYVSDVPGVLGAEGELLSELSAQQALDLLALEGVVDGGMIPKLESAVRALKAGVARAHLLDGRVEHALVLELFTPEGTGTMITPASGGSQGTDDPPAGGEAP